MISDEERIAAAKALRERAKRPLGKSMQLMFSETLGLYRTNMGWWKPTKATETWANIVNYLADLIDRGTCHNASGHQDMTAQKPKTRKRAIYLVTDFGGDWEDAWERPVIAFTDKAAAEECAAKRETRQYDEYGPVWDYEGSEVKEIPLVDFGDRQEEK